ncbi:MAG: hypothetical protein KDK97_08800, partial [Verrucomicrobiales bacterium]|nr:hypothetical protein [Verrucomicrobiales bacterium]
VVFEAKQIDHPSGLLDLGLIEDENRAQFPLGSQRLDNGAVSGALFGLKIGNDLVLQFRTNGGDKLVGFHTGPGGPRCYHAPSLTATDIAFVKKGAD